MEQLSLEWAAHSEAMLAWLDGLDADQRTHRYVTDKWSVLEHLEHLFISEKGTSRLMAMPAEPQERDLLRSRNRMANGLSDLTTKFSGGSSLDPKGRFKDYAEWRAAYLANRATILDSAQNLGLDGLCTAFPHPYFGNLTRGEWLVFSMLHADRHMAQMRAMVS